MPEGAAAAAEKPGAPSAPVQPASPAPASTPTSELGSRISDVLKASQVSSELRGGADGPSPHWKEVYARQAEEVGTLRKKVREMEERLTERASSTVDLDDDSALSFDESKFWQDPRGIIEARERKIREAYDARLQEMEQKFESRLRPVDEGIAMRKLQDSNPIVREMFSNDEILSELKELTSDPDLLRSVTDQSVAPMSSAMLYILGKRYLRQAAAKASAPAPERPEEAGGASPSAVPSAQPSVPEGPAAPKTIDDGVKEFWKAARAAGVRI